MDAAKLLGEAEAMAANAPRIRVPAACNAPDTLQAIPLLMREWQWPHVVRVSPRT